MKDQIFKRGEYVEFTAIPLSGSYEAIGKVMCVTKTGVICIMEILKQFYYVRSPKEIRKLSQEEIMLFLMETS